MKRILKLMVGFAFAAPVVAGTFTSCYHDDGFAGPGGPGVAGVGGGATAGAGGANEITFDVTMTGMQMVPATVSGGTAPITVTLNKTTGTIAVTGMFSGLSSPATEAHVHGPGAVGSNGPVLFPLSVPSNVSGAITGGASMNPAQTTDMLAGMTYVDIHTTYFPEGEIRAQISAAP